MTVHIQLVAKLGRTHAIAAFIDDHAAFKRAHAATTIVYALTSLLQTAHALVVGVEAGTWRTHTVAGFVHDVTFLHSTLRH